MHDPDLFEANPGSDSCGTGVLVLSGSSGAVEQQRAEVLARHGARALAVRWFGGVGQQPGPWDVPLETFIGALDRLKDVDRIGILGASFGAEAALLVSALDPRVDAVVALAPTAYVWAGVEPTGRVTSHWTWQGTATAYVPFDDTWTSPADPPAYRSLYEQSVRRFPQEAIAAAIPVEQIRGSVTLVAGEDDLVWPSASWSSVIADRRATHGLPTTTVTHPAAGHRAILPGESHQARGHVMARGGNPDADAALGAKAWPFIRQALKLHE